MFVQKVEFQKCGQILCVRKPYFEFSCRVTCVFYLKLTCVCYGTYQSRNYKV